MPESLPVATSKRPALLLYVFCLAVIAVALAVAKFPKVIVVTTGDSVTQTHTPTAEDAARELAPIGAPHADAK
jgi:hypothetical protein